jgi:hypothetical protein
MASVKKFVFLYREGNRTWFERIFHSRNTVPPGAPPCQHKFSEKWKRNKMTSENFAYTPVSRLHHFLTTILEASISEPVQRDALKLLIDKEFNVCQNNIWTAYFTSQRDNSATGAAGSSRHSNLARSSAGAPNED